MTGFFGKTKRETADVTAPPAPATTAAWDRTIATVEARSASIPMVQFGVAPDPAARLPAEAADRLEMLRDKQRELRAVVRSTTDEANDLNTEVQRAAQRLRELTDPAAAARQSSGNAFSYGPDHPSVVQARDALDQLSAKMARLTEKRDAWSYRSQEVGEAVRNLESYLKSVPADVRLELVPVAAKPAKGETLADAVARTRREGAELRARLAEVAAAPIRSTNAKRLAHEQIDQLAARGAPDCWNLIEAAGDISWPEVVVQGDPQAILIGADMPRVGGYVRSKVPDTLAVLAWLNRDSLLRAIDTEIDASADDAAALTDEQRAERRAELKVRLLDTERHEAALVEAAGGELGMRPDIDPRAYLGVTGPEPRI